MPEDIKERQRRRKKLLDMIRKRDHRLRYLDFCDCPVYFEDALDEIKEKISKVERKVRGYESEESHET